MGKFIFKFKSLLTTLINQVVLKIVPTPKILTVEDSIRRILENKKSVSRFGDGELICLLGGSIRYQHSDALLAKRLKQILSSKTDKVEVCLPDVFSNKRLKLRTMENQMFWRRHLLFHRFDWYRLLYWNRVYLNTAVSRFYIPFSDKIQSNKNSYLLKKVWEGENILVIEGEKSRLGVGNDLFGKAKSISRIICPSENAFQKYNEILKVIEEYDHNKEVLVLIALGPTATVLAYDLSEKGHWAIDIGHVDLEYEWMKRGVTRQEKVEGKYVNEVVDGNVINENLHQDDPYWNQIKENIV